jgi:nucleotide-binding universal stress UspA family protein
LDDITYEFERVNAQAVAEWMLRVPKTWVMRGVLAGSTVRSEAARMFERILVPLDGSKMAERALPVAEAIAGKFDATLILVRAVIRPRVRRVPLNAAAFRRQQMIDVEHYLRSVQGQFAGTRSKVEVLGVEGDSVTEVLLRVAREREVDLIVGVTQGRSGLSRMIHGSTIEDLVRDPTQPVLAIRGEE